MLLTATLGVVIERLAYRPLRTAPRLSAVITALGVGLFLEHFTLAILGPEPRRFPDLISTTPWQVAGLTLTELQLLTILLSAVIMILLDLLVRRTLLGMAMRAISYNRPIVPLMGVPVDRVISLTFALGSAIAAAGGLVYALAYPVLDPYMGVRIGWWASPRWWAASATSGGPCWGALFWGRWKFSPRCSCRPQLIGILWRFRCCSSCWSLNPPGCWEDRCLSGCEFQAKVRRQK